MENSFSLGPNEVRETARAKHTPSGSRFMNLRNASRTGLSPRCDPPPNYRKNERVCTEVPPPGEMSRESATGFGEIGCGYVRDPTLMARL